MSLISDSRADSAPLGDDSLLSHPLFGGGLPPQAEYFLSQAGENYSNAELALDFLSRAENLAPGHFAVLIGFYRFFFYKGRLQEALNIANVCLTKTAREKNFAVDWREVRAQDADFGDYDDVVARFYMFCLKGYAYLRLRLGDYDEGRAAIAKLFELDATDKINARLLLDILQRQQEEADDDEG